MKHWKTYVDLTLHSVSTLILAWFFYRATGSWMWPALAAVGGILIDIDHLFDYFLYYGWKFDLKTFFNHEYLKSGRVRIVFHSIELIAFMWALSFIYSWAIPIASGITVHLLIDFLFAHSYTPLSLSLIFRWRNQFKIDKICPGLDFDES